MKRLIFSRPIHKVFWTLLIFQAGCDVPSSSPAQYKDNPETELDSLIPVWFTRTEMQGASIAGPRSGQVQFGKGYVFADKSNYTAVTVATRFQIGSAKAITATAIRRWHCNISCSDLDRKTGAPNRLCAQSSKRHGLIC